MFEQIVFGGGGARCFWEAGVIDAFKEQIELRPSRVSAVSGGAVVAAAFLGGNLDRLRAAMRRQFEQIESNVRLTAMANENSMLPHCSAYHRAIEEAFGPDEIDRIKNGPIFRARITRLPPGWAQPVGIAVGSLVHEAERVVRQTPHGRWVAALGFTPEWVVVNRTEGGSELADLLIASGCIPPFIPLQSWRDEPAIDGSLIDNAPVFPGPGRSLVLVTRCYDNLPRRSDRVYASPSEELPASKLDFSDAEAVERAWRLGRVDGARLLQRLK